MDTIQAGEASDVIPLVEIEDELTRQLHAGKEGEAPVRRARMSNLVIFCNRPEQAQKVSEAVPEIVAAHPARVVLLIGESDQPAARITGTVNVWCQIGGSRQRICSEQVTLRAGGPVVDNLPFAVRTLLIGDLPTNLWWAAPTPPALAGPLLYDLIEGAQQIIYDSIGWAEPARGVVATAAWLAQFERGLEHRKWRVASDLNWRRLKYWRRLLGQALDPASAPGALESISEVLVEHGPHAVVQAWVLVSWLASRLRWRVAAAKVQPGVEIAWQVTGPQRGLTVRLRRLAEGPSEIRRVRIASQVQGQPAALNVIVEDERRLAVTFEAVSGATRTVTLQPHSLADLVGRQLSDRERDPVFRESMAVAQVFAHSVLR